MNPECRATISTRALANRVISRPCLDRRCACLLQHRGRRTPAQVDTRQAACVQRACPICAPQRPPASTRLWPSITCCPRAPCRHHGPVDHCSAAHLRRSKEPVRHSPPARPRLATTPLLCAASRLLPWTRRACGAPCWEPPCLGPQLAFGFLSSLHALQRSSLPPPTPETPYYTMLGDIAWRGFSLAFGLTNFLALAGTAAFRDGAFTKSASEEEKKELAVGMHSPCPSTALTFEYN